MYINARAPLSRQLVHQLKAMASYILKVIILAALAASGALAAAVSDSGDESLLGAETFNFGHEFGVGPWGAWGALHGGFPAPYGYGYGPYGR